MVGVAGFEPAAHWSQTSCATKLRYTPILSTHIIINAEGPKIKLFFARFAEIVGGAEKRMPESAEGAASDKELGERREERFQNEVAKNNIDIGV